ncbi:MAG TPA: hypothetical protein VNI84_04585, partial [Pyrinomonadaceae bacterium]|nr:hypothetical protein [Pyrinomonadaceae bacterium]
NKQLNATFNAEVIAHPANVFIRLYTTALTPAGVGTEVAGTGYAAKSVPCNAANFPVVTDGSIENALAIAFGTAGSAWGTIVAFGVWDAATLGNLLWWGDIAPGIVVANGAVLSIPVGLLNFTENNT